MAVMRENKRNSTLLGSDHNALVWLVIINAVVFASLFFIELVFRLSGSDAASFQSGVLQWFILPAPLSELATRPWTTLTYMFTHVEFFGLLGTVLWLWGFGYILQDLTGNKKIIPIYLYGGFAGGLFFIATQYAIPALRVNISGIQPLMGGGASVMAIALATTTLSPGYRLFPMINGGIPLWIMTLIFVVFDLSTLGAGNAGIGVAHLAGAATGFVFIKQMQQGNDWSDWMNNLFDWINNLFNPEKKYLKTSGNQVFYKATKKPFQKISSRFSQQKLDEILDKINEDGYSSLSNDEKDYLKKASKEDL